MMEQIRESANCLRQAFPMGAELGIVLGSGLGPLADELTDAAAIPFAEVPHFARSTAPDHAGRLVCGTLAGKRVLCMQGRLHGYEGLSPAEVAYPIRVMKAFGLRSVILTNAAGGICPELSVGDFLCISDHLYFFDDSPVKGPHLPLFGERFFDMSNAYDKQLRRIALTVMREQGLPAREGVYAYMPGPQFETPAEIRALRVLGADAVGMSTVAEAIAAVQCGMRTLGISCISNPAAGISLEPLSDRDVNEVASRRSAAFTKLLRGILSRL